MAANTPQLSSSPLIAGSVQSFASLRRKFMNALFIRMPGFIGKVSVVLLVVAASVAAALGQSQATAADLSGTVVDPNGAVVAGATVTARNLGTGLERSSISSEDGSYQLIALPPGEYEVTAEAATFKKVSISPVRLTVGQAAELRIAMEIGAADAVVNVTGESVELIETTKTNVSTTIDETRIDNLPISERSATGFALTISTVGRDNGRPVGPAPTSGLNIGGQRGRSTLVQVDGADYTDNSINAARSTVSQEAVQEYQVATNSYAAEFGRATCGIVKGVTKSGTNDCHGNVFGFLRQKTSQARNASAPISDNDPTRKPPFTRVQYGATFGGPIVKDRTFFFTSFEQRRRQESGFFTSDVGAGLNGSVTIGAPFLPFTNVYTNITPAQATYIQGELARAGTIADAAVRAQVVGAAITYATFASSGGQLGLNGFSPLRSPGG